MADAMAKIFRAAVPATVALLSIAGIAHAQDPAATSPPATATTPAPGPSGASGTSAASATSAAPTKAEPPGAATAQGTTTKAGKDQPAATTDPNDAPPAKPGAGKASSQRFEPTEKVRPDFDVAFPVDI
jgi:hypothetical protein